MDLHLHSRALKYFDMIRRCGSIREAARRLHVSSSAVNRQLLQLERELGAPLFERLPGGLLLTPAGEIMSRHVITVLQDAQRMEGEMDALKGIRRGAIEAVCVESLTYAFMPRILDRMLAKYPGVTLNVRIAGSANAAQAVARGEADVAIGFVRQRTEGLRQAAAGTFSLGAIVPPGHPLSAGVAAGAQVSFAECARHPLILPTEEISIHWELRALLAGHKRARNVALETSSFELMKGFALRGTGVAFVNRFGIERELQAGQLRHIPLRGAARLSLGAYVRAGRALSPALDAFVRLAAAEIERREAQEA